MKTIEVKLSDLQIEYLKIIGVDDLSEYFQEFLNERIEFHSAITNSVKLKEFLKKYYEELEKLK